MIVTVGVMLGLVNVGTGPPAAVKCTRFITVTPSVLVGLGQRRPHLSVGSVQSKPANPFFLRTASIAARSSLM